MPTSLQSFKAALETRWATATAPADGSGLVYRWIDTLTEERGNGRHRELTWRLADSTAIIGQHDEQREWEISAELFIDRRGRTLALFRNALENEASDLVLRFHGMTALGSGVIAADLLRVGFEERGEPKRAARAGGVAGAVFGVATFSFRVLVRESA
jgi:hypothetical protein